MMGSENADGFEETNLNAQRDDMENLDLGVDGGDHPLKISDVNGDTSNSGYRSAMPFSNNAARSKIASVLRGSFVISTSFFYPSSLLPCLELSSSSIPFLASFPVDLAV